MKIESSYPQDLKGFGNFHTGSITNPATVQITFDNNIELNVKWQDKNEVVKLIKQN
jgi:hypothetical protein